MRPSLRFRAGAQVRASDQTLFAGALPGLPIQIDEHKKQRQISEIIDSDYFQQLQQRAAALRARRSDSAG